MLEVQKNPMFDISHTSIIRTLKEELMEDDFDRRTQFCKQMMAMLDNMVIQLEHVFFSDKCTFTLHGYANRQNCRYWSRENPHWMRDDHTQFSGKVNVWAEIVGNHIIGPFIIDGNLNGDN
ncbi:unnamed protein product [Psylliodes chrysocephalus]|uniref:Transposase n=1 Tax=Psylliodes chrysocephalus TaxID=3402493 RepID=A0A9P0GMW9_9CUCU|nr:unnamed protein product [Psylliodes chrysocephala]